MNFECQEEADFYAEQEMESEAQFNMEQEMELQEMELQEMAEQGDEEAIAQLSKRAT